VVITINQTDITFRSGVSREDYVRTPTAGPQACQHQIEGRWLFRYNLPAFPNLANCSR
jgi:hypothetical protein